MAAALMSSPDAPMSELNTTPLIDVMLVLLVMFIITIPVATHSIDVDLPVPCGNDCQTLPKPDRVQNKIVIDSADRLLWNGTQVTQAQLGALLAETTEMAVEPELQFEPEGGASYSTAALTLRTIKASGVTKFGFVGNEKYRQFAAN